VCLLLTRLFEFGIAASGGGTLRHACRRHSGFSMFRF
jgi:hypothetical protein